MSTSIVSPVCLLGFPEASLLRTVTLLGVARANRNFRPLSRRASLTFMLKPIKWGDDRLARAMDAWICLAVARPKAGLTGPFAYRMQSFLRMPNLPSGTIGTEHPTALFASAQCLPKNTLFRGAHRKERLLLFLKPTRPDRLGSKLMPVRMVGLTRTATNTLTFFTGNGGP